ncbi:MAG: aldehyde dehydrogenase family protein [Steroidobacter sp.]|nr:aldehyde dehydrogenase family protein [Steroidobacter sp.]MBL8265288.1 aldehyde dehydrogenase family protein [Steroidobacter sp.]
MSSELQMYDCRKFFINGEWHAPAGRSEQDVINPATEQPVGKILLGTPEDVDAAVQAARKAFETFSQTSRAERIELLEQVIAAYKRNAGRLAQAISAEMGAPLWLSEQAQVGLGLGHLQTALDVLKRYEFEEQHGRTRLIREPIGVCGLITPWNWPLNQIGCKVAPALAVGCTVVLKPSEVAPLSAHVFAEILVEAGVPKGVFNLVDGEGPSVGEALARHPLIDMVSFTGSTRAGAQVAKAAADTVKRVSQELGGKSANIILDDADLTTAVTNGMRAMVLNSGQSCNAPARMLVPEPMYERAVQIAKQVAENVTIGDPQLPGIEMGPVANQAQFGRIQALLEAGAKEGARVVTGGVGRPTGMERGYFVKPTVFADVDNRMSVAQQEIFGPVLVMIPYRTEAEAISIANDTVYGLSGYVQSADLNRAMRVAAKLRTGMVHLNGAAYDIAAPFGGYKQSGNGREWGSEGFKEFLEIKAVMAPA